MRPTTTAALGVLLLVLTVVAGACMSRGAPPDGEPAAAPSPGRKGKSYTKPSDEVLRKTLTKLQYHVTQENGTERPFKNPMHASKKVGIYVDVVSGEPLFASIHKFDSGTGWPSFFQPLEPKNVVDVEDTTHGMRRVEVRSKHGDSHLGHVFNDGPKPTGLRYCINAAALRFIPQERLAAEGYEDYSKLFVAEEKDSGRREVATLAGGCFWGVEDLLRKLPGVIDTQVGYTGGTVEDPTYKDVKTGKSGHAEAVRIVFDPQRISYADLLAVFFRLHDPSTKDRQGNDRGTQYRSAIFFHSDEQRAAAEQAKKDADASGRWSGPVVTQIVPAAKWTDAEGYHQDYLVRNPNGYTCHYLRD